MFVLVRCRYPESYDAADHAVIEVNEDLILMLDKRMAQARRMYEPGFYGMKWWDHTPIFMPCRGPDDVGLKMDEAEFESSLEMNGYIRLADDIDVVLNFPSQPETRVHVCYAQMGVVTLTIGVLTNNKDGNPVADFHWHGLDKHVSNGSIETDTMYQETIDEWAEMIGCVEMLQKVRSCRGVRA